ncbi:hypothetical protein POM88_018301 [Heracleum sosnowskyi]|uniref:NB-ARC domain-containing protein n=1 Tax=Heracleum sosnowskyi TaxID=360622 RepID=A0AAD8N084_9APIA|nr:hypothetical protein POM88_018301 [Heracleum sosnowskyi]
MEQISDTCNQIIKIISVVGMGGLGNATLVVPKAYHHSLRFLTEKESWDLLWYKIFLKESCPSALIELGEDIARKCDELPLSIAVMAGVLVTNTSTYWWSKVSRDLNSIAKDYEIPAWKLIMFWVAKGFIKFQAAENKLEYGNNLEELEGQLKDLVSKSLVIVSKSSSIGGVKGVLFMMCCVTCVLKKQAREMDLSSIGLYGFPVVIGYLLELRYTALCNKGHDLLKI